MYNDNLTLITVNLSSWYKIGIIQWCCDQRNTEPPASILTNDYRSRILHAAWDNDWSVGLLCLRCTSVQSVMIYTLNIPLPAPLSVYTALFTSPLLCVWPRKQTNKSNILCVPTWMLFCFEKSNVAKMCLKSENDRLMLRNKFLIIIRLHVCLPKIDLIECWFQRLFVSPWLRAFHWL